MKSSLECSILLSWGQLTLVLVDLAWRKNWSNVNSCSQTTSQWTSRSALLHFNVKRSAVFKRWHSYELVSFLALDLIAFLNIFILIWLNTCDLAGSHVLAPGVFGESKSLLNRSLRLLHRFQRVLDGFWAGAVIILDKLTQNRVVPVIWIYWALNWRPLRLNFGRYRRFADSLGGVEARRLGSLSKCDPQVVLVINSLCIRYFTKLGLKLVPLHLLGDFNLV